MRLFTDDCLLYRTITSTHDHMVLQDDLNALTNSNVWQMEFNVSKCKILQVSTCTKCNYVFFSMNIESQSDTGIISCYIWSPHINSICSKANID